jgi:predicted flap endonuclease-1-like 5' DNA nuclease
VGFLSFVVGVIVGVIAAWWFFERRDAQSREAMEAGWKKKLDHVEAEVRRADAAHEETKERLRQLQQERLPAPTEKAGAAEPAPTPPAPGPTPVAPGPAGSATPLGEAERAAQARRRIDAKLAQLPAGSSARRRLLAERAALDGSGQEQGEPTQKLFTPPPEPPDDLERIRGIGPVLRQQLNKLGITTFAQLAAFSDKEITRLDEVLDFKGRVAREGWVEQAKALRDQR